MVPRGIARCMFCDPTRFEVIIGAGGNTAASVIRCLSMFNKKDGTVFKEAMEDPANHKLSKYFLMYLISCAPRIGPQQRLAQSGARLFWFGLEPGPRGSRGAILRAIDKTWV